MGSPTGGVLEGVRVLDFGRYIAGPYCAAVLGELGADVIRFDKREGSEDRYVQPVAPTGDGAMFLQMNRNKRSITLDPMHPEGRAVVERLVATADVVVANLPPPTLKRMGLDHASLKAIKPDIILTRVSAFGDGGPMSDRVGFDGVASAMSGAMWFSGEPGTPTRLQAPYVDITTAISCAMGTLAALMHRQKTGEGQEVEGALLISAMNCFAPILVEQAALGLDRQPTGTRGQTAAPADIVATKDGWIMMQGIGPSQFRRWAQLMGEEEKWCSDPKYKDDLSRGDNGAAISARTREWAAQYTTAEALDLLSQAKLPGGPVYTPRQAVEDPHVAAMGYLHPMPYDGLNDPVSLVEMPVRLTGSPGSIRKAAPLLGADTDTVLAEIGLAAAEIGALREKGVI
ncbi:CaiB/BaiF CoA transferase family protein [Marinibaculum pumilum]|uniref:CaiB/BaiF CoA transferase family protein n=1 Tax=Marinibaculum pumilum TaxID=1766165 RepID=A0ABV7L7H3_9PROT